MVSHRACSEAIACTVHYRREARVDAEGFVDFEAFPINVQMSGMETHPLFMTKDGETHGIKSKQI